MQGSTIKGIKTECAEEVFEKLLPQFFFSKINEGQQCRDP